MTTNRYRFFALFVGVILLSSLFACSPAAYEFDVIERIGVNSGTVYALASRDCNYCDEDGAPRYFSSDDLGQTWEEVISPTIDIVQILNGDDNTQNTVCLPTDSFICYRIAGEERVETSSDSGNTWQVDWRIPNGRKYYMQRHSSYGPFPQTIPLDLQIIETNAGHYVVVAMGNQGVLVKSLDGNWNRYSVGTAVPTPYQASSFAEANQVLLLPEQVIIILIALCLFLLLSVCTWLLMYLKADALLRRKISRACMPFGLPILLFLVYGLVGLVGGRYVRDLIDAFQGPIFIMSLLGFLITWLAVFIVSIKRRFVLFALLACIGFSVLSYFGLFFPFQLWALGAISVYETAGVIALVLGISILIISIIAEKRITPLAVKQDAG